MLPETTKEIEQKHFLKKWWCLDVTWIEMKLIHYRNNLKRKSIFHLFTNFIIIIEESMNPNNQNGPFVQVFGVNIFA